MKRNRTAVPSNVRDAQKVKNDAIEALSNLEARVEDGDLTITTADLRGARDRVDLSTMQLTGAKRSADQMFQQVRDKRAGELADEVRQTRLPNVPAAVAAVIESVEALSGALDAHNRTARVWADRCGEIASTGHLGATTGLVPVVNGHGHTIAVRVDGITYWPKALPHILSKLFTVSSVNSSGGPAAVPFGTQYRIKPDDKAGNKVDLIRDELKDPAPPRKPLVENEDAKRKPDRWAEAPSILPLTDHEKRAERAATLRHERDEMMAPFDPNDTSKPYPADIDNPDLVALVPDLMTLMRMRANREKGYGFVAERPAPTPEARDSGVILSDTPI